MSAGKHTCLGAHLVHRKLNVRRRPASAMPGPSGPPGPRPKTCYYKYSAASAALAVGFFVCTLHTVMQDGTTSTTHETLAFDSDPHMKYVLDSLPADWTDEQKMQAIEANYGEKCCTCGMGSVSSRSWSSSRRSSAARTLTTTTSRG